MNGLQPDIDLSAFAGARISQVCIGEHQCIIRFGDSLRVAIESTCELQNAAGAVLRIPDYRARATELCALIGASIQSATRTRDGGLMICIDPGIKLEILNDVSEYEAFQVHIGTAVYVA